MTYLVIIGAVVGAVLGLINFLLAAKRKRKGLGVAALVACILLGAAAPILGFLAFIVFLIVILVKGHAVDGPAVEVPDETPQSTGIDS
jgi:hypothetical protein